MCRPDAKEIQNMITYLEKQNGKLNVEAKTKRSGLETLKMKTLTRICWRGWNPIMLDFAGNKRVARVSR